MVKHQADDSPFIQYGYALMFTLAALALSTVFWPIFKDSPFLLFIAAVVFSSWKGGLRPAMLSTALGIVTMDYFLIEPAGAIFAKPSHLVQFGIFSLIALLISWLERNRTRIEQSLNEIKEERDIILQSAADGIIAQDRYGRLIYANVAAAKLLGFESKESMLSTASSHLQNRYQLFDETGTSLPYSEMPRNYVFRTGESVSKTFKMRFTETGEERWINLISSPVFNDQGKVKFAVSVFRDISDQLKTEHIHSRLAGIVQNSDDAIIGKDLNRLIQSWNPGAEKLYGYKPDEVINKHISILFPEDIKPREMNLTTRVFSGERIHHYETKRLHKDGHVIDISLTISPIRDSTGAIIGYSTIERDITRKKKHEAEIRQLSLESAIHRRRLETIIANIPGIVYVTSGDNSENQTIDFISQYAEAMLGYSMEQWHSASDFWEQIVHPDDRSQVADQINQTYMGKEIDALGFRCVTQSEKIIYMESHASAIKDKDGKPVGTCGVIMDITKRKQAEDDLQQATMLLESLNQRLRNIVDNVPGVVFESTANIETNELQFNFISDYVEKLLGYSAEKWRSAPHFWEQVIPPSDLEQTLRIAMTSLEERKPGRTQLRGFDSDGNMHNLEAYFHVIPNGKQAKSYGVIMDITERKQAEEAITRYTEELRRSNEELEQFAYVASHDLQEPLRKISSYLQLIEDRYADKLDQDGREFIDFAVDGAARMKQLIIDLLTYSRVQRNKGTLELLNIEDILSEVLANLEFSIAEHQAQITYDPLPEVFANEGQLFQLFQNLISNAIKFHGTEPPKIHIGAERQGNHWQISVSDNGIGMRPEYLDRIFVIFQRLHSRSKYPGTGIGLAICKRIIQNHGGHIWVESEVNQGTTFYFTLPAESNKGRSLWKR